MNYFLITCIVLLMLVILIALVYIYRYGKLFGLSALFDEAKNKSAFNPTKFRIYDQSPSSTVCDRLIIVDPFDWIIWCYRGELYIVNPEGLIVCGPNQTPAIRVTKSAFLECCLFTTYATLLENYKKLKPHIIPYAINSERFTILDALNLLVTKYITFDDEIEIARRNKINEIVDLKKYTNIRRKLNSTDVVAATQPKRKLNESDLLHHLRQHHSQYRRNENVEFSHDKNSKS